MKNYLLLLFLSIAFSVNSQQLRFNCIEFAAEPNSEDKVAELFDKFYAEKKFKSGGVVLESLGAGIRSERTHRLVFMWEKDKWGMEEELAEFESDAFWRGVGNYINSDVPPYSYAGRIHSWKEGNTDITSSVHIWDFKPADPVAFKKAHDKIVKDASPAFEDRTVGFGTYDVNQPNGATHWVVITGRNVGDHIELIDLMETKYNKELTKYFEDRSEVNNIRDFVVDIVKRYQ